MVNNFKITFSEQKQLTISDAFNEKFIAKLGADYWQIIRQCFLQFSFKSVEI